MHFLLAFALLLQGLLSLDAIPWAGDTPPPPGTQQAICDSKTGVIYYVESDLGHVAAISPKGKILWVCEVLKPDAKRRDWIASISFGQQGQIYRLPKAGTNDEKKGEDCLIIAIWREGYESATINKKTGKIVFSGTVS